MNSLWQLLTGLFSKAGADAAAPRPAVVAESSYVPPAPPPDALLARIGDVNDFSRPRPLVGLELFFEGNTDFGAIGCNLNDTLGPPEFYGLLKPLREREDIHDILVEITQQEAPEDWPHSNTLWFITTATAAEVRAFFPEHLAPDDMIEGFEAGRVEPYDLPAGYRAVGAWYD